MWGKKTLTTRCNCNTRVWRFIAQDILWVHVQIGHHGTPVLVNMRVCLVKRGGPVLLLPLVVLSPSQAGVKCNLTASTLLQGPESVGIATIFIFYWFWRNADSQWTQLSQYASMHMHTRTHHRYPYKERSLDNVSLPRGIPPPPLPINKWPSSPVAEEDKRTAGVGTIMQQLAQQTTDPDIQINNTSPKTPFPGRIHS